MREVLVRAELQWGSQKMLATKALAAAARRLERLTLSGMQNSHGGYEGHRRLAAPATHASRTAASW